MRRFPNKGGAALPRAMVALVVVCFSGVASGTILGGPAGGDVVLERSFDQVMLVSDGTTWVIFDSDTAR